MGLSQNSILKDGKLNISPYEWFIPIKNGYKALEKEYLKLEPSKLPMNTARTKDLASVRTRWRGQGDSNPWSPP